METLIGVPWKSPPQKPQYGLSENLGKRPGKPELPHSNPKLQKSTTFDLQNREKHFKLRPIVYTQAKLILSCV
ncbi:hypothetical protein SUGI_0502880 [Cryptomeria japonica]|nr:hypothetical protein SUGI_0502880 [Cryptomeria japonica]